MVFLGRSSALKAKEQSDLEICNFHALPAFPHPPPPSSSREGCRGTRVQRPGRCVMRVTVVRKLPRLARGEAESMQTEQAATTNASLASGATRNYCVVEA